MSLLALSSRAVADEDDPYGSWYFTSEEVAAAFNYQQNYGERIRSPLRAGDCLFHNGEFFASHRRQEFSVPCHFIAQVTRHLKEMLSAGAAKYLFPLDADHAHLGVPRIAWNKKYQHLPPEEIFPAILRDPGLVALYHTAEHLRITDRKTGLVDPEAKAWQEKRNVLGFFDGRPMQILTPRPNGQGVSMPDAYYSYSGFTFLASPRAELFLALERKIITFDVAFDGDYFDYAGAQHRSARDRRLARSNPR